METLKGKFDEIIWKVRHTGIADNKAKNVEGEAKNFSNNSKWSIWFSASVDVWCAISGSPAREPMKHSEASDNFDLQKEEVGA